MGMLAVMYVGFGGEISDKATYGIRVAVPDDEGLSFRYECGWHRLVRISPFDEQHRRHTSFVLVEINGITSDELVCSYIFDPYTKAINHLTGKQTDDVQNVLAGHPLGFFRHVIISDMKRTLASPVPPKDSPRPSCCGSKTLAD
jgi:protein subunit release factor B